MFPAPFSFLSTHTYSRALLRLRANRSLRLINHDRTRVNDSKGPSCVACSLLLACLPRSPAPPRRSTSSRPCADRNPPCRPNGPLPHAARAGADSTPAGKSAIRARHADFAQRRRRSGRLHRARQHFRSPGLELDHASGQLHECLRVWRLLRLQLGMGRADPGLGAQLHPHRPSTPGACRFNRADRGRQHRPRLPITISSTM